MICILKRSLWPKYGEQTVIGQSGRTINQESSVTVQVRNNDSLKEIEDERDTEKIIDFRGTQK